MPLTAREARLRYYYEVTQDIFWKWSLWPQWTKQLILLDHKSDSQMFNLTFFFLANGLPPALTKIWVTAGDVRDHVPLLGTGYSPKEHQDLRRVLMKYQNGTLFKGDKKVFDMILGRPVLM